MRSDRIIAVLCLSLWASAVGAQPSSDGKDALRTRLLKGICGNTCDSIGTLLVRSVVVRIDDDGNVQQTEEEVIYGAKKPLVRRVRFVPQFHHMEVRLVFHATEAIAISDLDDDSGVVRHLPGLVAVTPFQLRDPAIFAAVELSLQAAAGAPPVIEARHGQSLTRWTLDEHDRVVTTKSASGESTCSDFRRVNGVTLPFRCDSVSDKGRNETRAVVAVLVNSVIPEDVYDVHSRELP